MDLGGCTAYMGAEAGRVAYGVALASPDDGFSRYELGKMHADGHMVWVFQKDGLQAKELVDQTGKEDGPVVAVAVRIEQGLLGIEWAFIAKLLLVFPIGEGGLYEVEEHVEGVRLVFAFHRRLQEGIETFFDGFAQRSRGIKRPESAFREAGIIVEEITVGSQLDLGQGSVTKAKGNGFRWRETQARLGHSQRERSALDGKLLED